MHFRLHNAMRVLHAFPAARAGSLARCVSTASVEIVAPKPTLPKPAADEEAVLGKFIRCLNGSATRVSMFDLVETGLGRRLESGAPSSADAALSVEERTRIQVR